MEAENALRANIKQKGENSYYYAHQPRAQMDPVDAIVLEGDGIITGGDPRLVQVQERTTHTVNVVPIRNYSWADETSTVLVIITFLNGGALTSDQVDCRFDTKRVSLSVRVNELEEHKLILRRLCHSIVPDQCKFRVKNNRVTLVLKKETEMKWFSLVEAGKIEDDKDWS